MANFRQMALREGAIEVSEFRQDDFLKEATGGADSAGRCFAFVVAYLTCLRTGVAGKNLLEVLNLAVKKRDRAVIKEILGDSSKVSSNPAWLGTDLFNLQSLDQRLAEFYAGIGLEKEKEKRFDDRFFRNKHVGQFVADEKPLYSVIKSRVHIMSAVSQPLSERSHFAFFDPNFGEAIFRSRANLISFIAAFFSRSVINKGYRPSDKDATPLMRQLMGEAEMKLLKQETHSLVLTVIGYKEITPVPPPRRDQYGQLM